MNKIAYVCGPYRAETKEEIEANIRNAERVARSLWAYNIPTFCPHLNTQHFDGLCPDELFLEFDKVILRDICSLLVLLPIWERSSGSKEELLDVLEQPFELYDILVISSIENCEKEIREYVERIRGK